MSHRKFIETMSEADEVFASFHRIPNTEERSRLYTRWRCLLDKADQIERALGVIYEYDKEKGWHDPLSTGKSGGAP